ncbi:MAG: S-layer homology domain-containing protein [Ignavibacteriales bacterium]
MKNKILCFIVIFLFIFQTPIFAQVSNEQIQQQSANAMVKLGLLKGYENGNLGLERNITRAEFATVIIRMMGYEKNPIKVSSNISFKDLPKKHWAYSTVRMAASLGYIKGYSNKTFKPSNNITYAEAITIMVRVLGYGDKLSGKWPDNYIKKANELGILKNLDISESTPITRGNISILVTNSLNVEIKK